MGVGGQRHAPAALHPRKTRYPSYRRLGGPQGRSVRVRKISPLPGFDPQTVRTVAIRYTDWAIPAQIGGVVVKTAMNTGAVWNARNSLTSWEMAEPRGLCSMEVVVGASVQDVVERLTVAGAIEWK